MADYDQDEIIAMISDCEERESKLTEWEAGYIASVSVYPEKGWKLTDTQQARLTEIWERITQYQAMAKKEPKSKHDKRPKKLKDWAPKVMIICPRKGHEIGQFKTDAKAPKTGHGQKLKFKENQARIAGETMCCKMCGSKYIVDGNIHTLFGWYPEDPVLEPVPMRKR